MTRSVVYENIASNTFVLHIRLYMYINIQYVMTLTLHIILYIIVELTQTPS